MRSPNFFRGLVVFGAVLASSIAAPASTTELEPLESLRAIPQGWRQGRSPPAAQRLRFRIALKQENAYQFEQHVLAISNPDDPKYGEHMSRDELKAMLKPSSEASNAILGWLHAEGVSSSNIEDAGDWINFYVSATEAERIMDTKFYYYSNIHNGMERIRTLHYSVPRILHQHIHMIQPTTRFGQVRPERSTVFEHFEMGESKESVGRYHGSALNATFCNSTITPQCLRDLYQIGNFSGTAKNGNKIGVCGYLEQYAKFSDFKQFTAQYAPYASGENFTYVLINGGLATQGITEFNSVEANLDVQYAYPLSYPTPGFYYSTGGRGELIPDLDQPTAADNQNEPYLDFLHYILALPDWKLPTTLTTSYGEDEQSVPEAYSNMTCSMFAQLGARGVSVLFSSGDTGPGSACQTNDGKNTTRLLPIFPAACPYLTSVGGTYRVQPEIAIAFSSGGFSDRYPRPAYQNAAVTTYLNSIGDTFKGLFNPNGRGFPDVAAQAYNFTVIDSGREIRVGGTSASSPAFAAIVALLNGDRLSKGRKPLGFLNPFIYKYGYRGLTDIVAGGSRGCTGRDIYSGLPAPFVPGAGWNATKGWDPVTGYGTPNFPALLKLTIQEFVVNGTAIPDVDFDIGESYAGLLPISSASNETRELYFWFFPSANPLASDEITIWLNGGPGCSSLEGLLQENGPFLWQYGTFAPVKNPYTWVNLTNMVWIEQPVGTGFSQGTPTATNEDEVAEQFLGFFKNFVDTFALQGRKVFITGESYAGYYVPYIANAMLNANDTTYYDVRSIMIYDPSTSTDAVQEQIPAVAFVDANAPLFPLNSTFLDSIHTRASSCGYTSFLETYLTFPPAGPLPNPPNASAPGCDLFNDIFDAISLVNPCFDIYQIATTCPLLWDVLGFPGSFNYLPAGAEVYFNRTDVQRAINAPLQEWAECQDGVLDTDASPPSGLSVLPSVIERLERTVVAHGALDMILIANGTLLMIQNMTWGGAQGFQQRPSAEFFVPYHAEAGGLGTLAGSGVFGTTRTERKLTWVEVALTGH
ncbi:MAG: hypothetical protein LQ348_003430, partial [Seirophora lacunosa]